MNTRDPRPDKAASDFLCRELIAANFTEFHQRVGLTLQLYLDDQLMGTDALWRIKHLHSKVQQYNLSLETQRVLYPPSTRALPPPNNGEEPDSTM